MWLGQGSRSRASQSDPAGSCRPEAFRNSFGGGCQQPRGLSQFRLSQSPRPRRVPRSSGEVRSIPCPTHFDKDGMTGSQLGSYRSWLLYRGPHGDRLSSFASGRWHLAWSALRRSGWAPPGIRRRKAGTDHRTVVAGPRRREYRKASAPDCRGRDAAEGAGAKGPCHRPTKPT